MGSYLSEPVCDKISSDEANDRVKCGSSSMQGWRVTQEDAHNCILEFDNNCSFFSVYDGHGGHEVAQYCAQKLPDFIKSLDAYKEGNIEKALVDGFLGFDATIATKEVIAVLKELAGEKDQDDDDEENVNNLYEEATMPIEKVIEKYTNLSNPLLRNVKKSEGDKFLKSPLLRAKREDDCGSSSDAGASGSGCGSSNSHAASAEDVSSSCGDSSEAKSSDNQSAEKKPETNGSSCPDIVVTAPTTSDSSEAAAPETEGESSKTEVHTNGDIGDSHGDSVTTPPNGEDVVSKKGKGKALAKKSLKSPKMNTRPKRNANQLYKKLLDLADSDDESEDEEDKTFEGPNDVSDDDEEDGVNASLENDSDCSSGEECEEEEDDDEEDDDEDEEDYQFVKNMKEEPGSDSGCTAVVALLKGNELYVANAGDSRCVVCRNGKAVEMSFDHKPEDEPERERVLKAGGKVTADGRVNGGLNLSRAIGDHAYKQNKELSDREQMITALPDVKRLTISPGEDEFMVLACDGIWNYMSSQEVVDFVKPKLEGAEKISSICEMMFDHCLAPNTMGDGTGCDNMTAIIVQFKPSILKRAASPTLEVVDTVEAKRQKTEEADSQSSSA